MKKQTMLGVGLMTGAVVIVSAVAMHKEEPVQPEVATPVVQTAVVQTAVVQAQSEPAPATVDVATETQVLQEKQEERQAIAAETQAENEKRLLESRAAGGEAIKQAQEEVKVTENLRVQKRPESIELAKQQEQQKLEQQKQEQQKLEQQKLEQQKLDKQKEQKAQEQKAADKKKIEEQKATEKAKADKKKAEDKKAEDKKAQEQKATEKAKADKQKEQKAQEQKAADKKKIEEQKAAEKTNKAKADTATSPVIPKSYVVQAGDSLIGLSKRYGIPVSVLAEANGMGRDDALQRGRTIKIPSAREVKDLQYLAQKREQERLAKEQAEQKRQEINDRLAEARREAKKQGINDGYAVQVALATTQAKADEIVAAYKKAGYKVRTAKEPRGVRVIVGQERSREAAVILKQKINNDPSVSANGAWVIQDK